MTVSRPEASTAERVLIWTSVAAVVAVVLANVIRVIISADTAVLVRTMTCTASWAAAIFWAWRAKRNDVLVWLGSVALCGLLIAFCEAFAGGVGPVSLLFVVGPAGAGIGMAVLIGRCMETDAVARTAVIAAIAGFVVAIWLALEPGFELWKLVPNQWEISKNLEYRWGIRMGEERARFLFDTPMEAGVVQWFLGVICLAAGAKRGIRRFEKVTLFAAAILLFASVALTYTRAGLALGALSIGFSGLLTSRRPRIALVACAAAAATVFALSLAANRFLGERIPSVRNVASILDPTEAANRIRLLQLKSAANEVASISWQGKGADSFVALNEAPRLPEHESTPVGLIVSFGLGGVCLTILFGLHTVQGGWKVLRPLLRADSTEPDAGARIIGISLIPFALYGWVAPILSGAMFGVITFTIMGLLATTKAPATNHSGKP